MRTAISFLLMAAVVSAQSVVVLSEDGQQAWYAPDDQTAAVIADRIVRLTGDDPRPPGPIPPTEDQWGLVALSESEADKVTGDPNRDETANKLAAAYIVVGQQFATGQITQEQLKPTLELTFNFVTGSAKDVWKPWQSATQAKYNSVQFTDVKLAGQGLVDIGLGAARSSDAAIGDGTFLKLFLEVILPLILELIKLLSPEGVGV